MCTNYAPVQRQILRDIFGVEPPPAEWKPEAWPRQQWNDWLACRAPEVARTFMTLFPAEAMAAEPAPIVRRPKEPPPAAAPELPF